MVQCIPTPNEGSTTFTLKQNRESNIRIMRRLKAVCCCNPFAEYII